MCGIAGYVTYREHAPAVLDAMLEKLIHRGPDAFGVHHSRPFTGGMRRLSINDVDSGTQPFTGGNGSTVAFYNGEIYNYPTLRRELEEDGVRFRTRCDGEVLCHLYERYRTDMFALLDGMYAIALWDKKRQQLILARDIPGEKPLYYSLLDDGIVFASEIKSLICFPGIDLSLDMQALWDFPSFLWIPEPSTVFASVKALPRGHCMVVEDGGSRVLPIKNNFGPDLSDADDAEVIALTREVVTESVRSRLLSDVPVGSFLSGGLDSSIVTTIASRELHDLHTFTIGFERITDPYHGCADESEDAAALAKRLGTNHHTIRITAADFDAMLPDFVTYGDQPFSVSSGLGVMAVARETRKLGVKVLLSGDCADECFGGYSWYKHLPAVCAESGIDSLPDVSMQWTGLPMADRLEALSSYPTHKLAWGLHYYASETDKMNLFSPDMIAAASSSLSHFKLPGAEVKRRPEGFIGHDRMFYLPNEMLRKVDRMTMAHSVEGRPVFAAPAILKLAEGLRYRHMVRGGRLKWALRKAFAGVLPDEVIARPKHGFNVPVDHWLKGQWAHLVQQAFSSSSALARHGLIRADSFTRAQEMIADARRLCGHTIFSFIVLNLWLEGRSNGNNC